MDRVSSAWSGLGPRLAASGGQAGYGSRSARRWYPVACRRTHSAISRQSGKPACDTDASTRSASASDRSGPTRTRSSSLPLTRRASSPPARTARRGGARGRRGRYRRRRRPARRGRRRHAAPRGRHRHAAPPQACRNRRAVLPAPARRRAVSAAARSPPWSPPRYPPPAAARLARPLPPRTATSGSAGVRRHLRFRRHIRHLGRHGRLRPDQRAAADVRNTERGCDLPALVGHDVHLHRRGAVGVEAQHLRRPPRDVDDPVAVERPAVVDAQLQRAAILQVGHPHDARHRQRAMRRREVIHVVGFAAGGAASVEAGSVPRAMPLSAYS